MEIVFSQFERLIIRFFFFFSFECIYRICRRWEIAMIAYFWQLQQQLTVHLVNMLCVILSYILIPRYHYVLSSCVFLNGWLWQLHVFTQKELLIFEETVGFRNNMIRFLFLRKMLQYQLLCGHDMFANVESIWSYRNISCTQKNLTFTL